MRITKTRLQKIIIQEIKLNDRKVRGQLLDLSLGIVNKRIGDIALDTLKDLLDRAIAVEDLESQERIAMLLVNAAAKLKRA